MGIGQSVLLVQRGQCLLLPTLHGTACNIAERKHAGATVTVEDCTGSRWERQVGLSVVLQTLMHRAMMEFLVETLEYLHELVKQLEMKRSVFFASALV